MRSYLAVAAVLAASTCAFGEITAWNCSDDGDGAIVMNDALTTFVQDGPTEYTLSLVGAQYDYPAHVEGDFTTDSPEDPSVWIIQTVENFTDFDWTDYHVIIGMNQEFTIDNAMGPSGWTIDIIQPVPGEQPNNNGPGYVGIIDYFYGGPGTEILIGESGDFGFRISFLGSVDFCTEQIPTPEPTTLSLLVAGSLLLVRRRR